MVSNLQVWATIIGSHLTREPTTSPVLTKWWNLELTLATNFGVHAQMACGYQRWWPNFGYQIWFCTRLLNICIITFQVTMVTSSQPSSQGGDMDTRFAHLLQPIRDLAKNWDVDIASHLEEYLDEVSFLHGIQASAEKFTGPAVI